MPAIVEFYDEYQKCAQSIKLKKNAQDAFTATVNLYEDQAELHAKAQDKVFPHEKFALKSNFEILQKRLNSMKKQQQELNADVRKQNNHSRYLDREMNALKPEIIQLYKQRQQHQAWLVSHGMSMDEINRMLEKEMRHDEQQSVLPHNDERTWYMPELDRGRAEQVLSGKPMGTFLVRKSRNGGLALSIVYEGGIGSALILQTDRGFGFAEPYDVYPTLKDLVLHHATNTLRDYNEDLDTPLRFPVGSTVQFEQQDSAYIQPDKISKMSLN